MEGIAMRFKEESFPNLFKLRFLIHSRFIGLFILKLLTKKPMHGYQITEELNKALGINIPRQLVYFILKKFESKSLVSSEWVLEDGKRPKKKYRITDKGRKFLEHMMNQLKELIRLLEEI